jgi:hypothetical protein
MAAVGVVALLFAIPAVAVGRWVPRVELRAGGETQRGSLAWEEWTRRSGDYCAGYSADGPGSFPRALEVSPGAHTARFVFHTARRPKRVDITAWRAVDSHGNAIGAGQALSYELSPRRRDDGSTVLWRAVFYINVRPDYYLHLYARWRPGQCGGPRHMLRTFHIGSRATATDPVEG